MARETIYVVQAYGAGRGNGLKAETPVSCKTADAARKMAERLAESKLGVIAFANSGDQDLGDYDDEPVVLFQAGRVPEQFER